MYATEQVSDGRVPRITDLVQIDESRTNLRFSIVSDDGTLRKRVDFTDTRFRVITDEHLERREQVPFRSGQDLVPGLPDVMTHTYDLGTDGQVASGMGVIFDQYLGDSGFRGPFRFIDAFTFRLGHRELLEVDACRGGDGPVPCGRSSSTGSVYHSAQQILYFDRIDMIDGIHHAFVKLHALGNFTDRPHGESSYLMSAHVRARRPGDWPRVPGRAARDHPVWRRRERPGERTPTTALHDDADRAHPDRCPRPVTIRPQCWSL